MADSYEERVKSPVAMDSLEDNIDDDEDDAPINSGAGGSSSATSGKGSGKKRRRFSREEDEKIIEVRFLSAWTLQINI